MMSDTTHTWHRVTRAEPCIVCSRTDWCGRADDGLLLCMRSAEAPIGYRLVRTNPDGGNLFAPVDGARPAPTPPRRTPPKPQLCIDWGKVHREARARVHPGELDDFAGVELGLPGEPIDALEVGVADEAGSGWLFPERDGRGNIIGLVRRTPAGEKLALRGSRRGLTYAHPLADRDPVLVIEGQSDTAAAMTAGFTAVGRPSNSGGADLLADLLHGREVIVCGENDRKPDGRWPGREGAESIAKRLRGVCKTVRVAYPPEPIKDLRGWLTGGAM